jgi:hypothetical protein
MVSRILLPVLTAPVALLGRPPSVTAHLGHLSLTVRSNRSRHRLGPARHSRHVGSIGLGLLAVYWLRRSRGSSRWGVEHARARAHAR